MTGLRPSMAALLGVAAAVGLAAAPFELSAGLAVLVVLAAPAVVVLAARGAEARPLLVLFLVAVAVRTGVALLVHYASSPSFFALDDDWYTQVGQELARAWAGEGRAPEIHGALGYYRWNGILFLLLGPVPLAPTLANAVFGGLSALLAHGLARQVAGERAARTAGWLAALWPSLVLWSSLNLKDALAILAILLLLRGAQRLATRVSARACLTFAVGLFVLAQLRSYLVLVVAAACALAWLLPRLRGNPLAVGALLVLAALLLPVFGPVQDLAAENHLEALDHARRQMATGDSAYLGEADVSTPWTALRFLPVGLAYFLCAPAPWQLLNARQLLTLPEMLAWYALLPFVFRGAASGLRTRFADALPLASFALFATLSYALVEGNVGTAYRHRAQVLVPLLIFAAVGLARRRAPAREPETRLVPEAA